MDNLAVGLTGGLLACRGVDHKHWLLQRSKAVKLIKQLFLIEDVRLLDVRLQHLCKLLTDLRMLVRQVLFR